MRGCSGLSPVGVVVVRVDLRVGSVVASVGSLRFGAISTRSLTLSLCFGLNKLQITDGESQERHSARSVLPDLLFSCGQSRSTKTNVPLGLAGNRHVEPLKGTAFMKPRYGSRCKSATSPGYCQSSPPCRLHRIFYGKTSTRWLFECFTAADYDSLEGTNLEVKRTDAGVVDVSAPRAVRTLQTSQVSR